MKPIKSNVSVDNNPIPISDTSVGDHHKHRNLLAHAPERLHDEITADYTDMIHAGSPKGHREAAQSFHPQMVAQAPRGGRQPALRTS
jgi:hypothetical protein